MLARGFVGLRVTIIYGPNSVGWTMSIMVVDWLNGLVVSFMPFSGFGEVLVHLFKEWPNFPHV